MISNKMLETINEQINAETYSAYLYLSMSAYFDDNDLPGFASWMRAQAQEELFHAMKFYHFVYERAGKVVLSPIGGPPLGWASPLAAFEAVLEHEKLVTSLINNLVSLARDEKDFASDNFLQWYVSEQVEEESTADAIIKKLKMIGDDGTGLMMIDQELGQRVFVMPTATQG